MSQSAYIKLVQGSTDQEITLQDVQNRLLHYQEQTSKTGTQLGWDYAGSAFPYTIESKGDDRWFYLKGVNGSYKHIILGTGETTSVSGQEVRCIQVVLPDESTHGDKAKANELCKFIAKSLQAELTMFNGRTVYYNPRK
ncbi:DUF1885 family protein [Paenibacillus sp. GSMTC-2017]|uniref:DUF1885 family protein n=1 Tax=Paenibacillus sp. GSMTC-2017 TaxID=2794350 RepID=UPI0018D9784B|nr:DUF1885 family protein [Paenibacillus sp. GSMTC-2017]MBH5316820.1 DUF1885 family protein [Paenibacillus sp. GSMTC-2017]